MSICVGLGDYPNLLMFSGAAYKIEIFFMDDFVDTVSLCICTIVP